MSAAENLTHQPTLVSTSTPIDLEPFRSLGRAALDPGKHRDVAKITLRQLQVAREDPLHQTFTIASDDLLKQPGHLLAFFPSDGTVASATLSFFFTDSDRPHTVCLRPPRTIQIQFSKDIKRVLAWLDTSAFTATQTLAKATTILLFALAAAVSPISTLDLDDDDSESEIEISISRSP